MYSVLSFYVKWLKKKDLSRPDPQTDFSFECQQSLSYIASGCLLDWSGPKSDINSFVPSENQLYREIGIPPPPLLSAAAWFVCSICFFAQGREAPSLEEGLFYPTQFCVEQGEDEMATSSSSSSWSNLE